MTTFVKRLLCAASGVTLVLLSSTLMARSPSLNLADVPIPFGAKIQSVGDNVVHNGQSMTVATYESSLSLADTVAFFHSVWAAEPGNALPGLVENTAGEWLMLGRLQQGFQIVLQLRLAEEHRSTGYLSVMSLEAAAPGNKALTPLPGLEPLTTTRSQDAGRPSVLSVYSSQGSVESLARQLTGHWQDGGWTLVSSEAYAQSKVLLLNRDAAQLDVVISADSSGSTLVVVNESDNHE